jgi:hypothetical protein
MMALARAVLGLWCIVWLAGAARAQEAPPAGSVAWQRQLVSDFTTQVVSVGATPGAGVVAYGSFWGAIDPGSGAATASPQPWSRDLFLTRYDAFGRVLWTRVIATAGWDFADAVTVAPDGDLLVTGRSEAAEIDLGCGPRTVETASLAFVARLDAGGACVWSFVVAYDEERRLPRLFAAGAPEGRTVVAGTFMGRLELPGATLASWGAPDARNAELVVATLGIGGVVTRAAAYGAHPEVDDGNEHRLQQGAALGVDGYGNVVLAGSFSAPFVLGDTRIDPAGGRGFVAKLRPGGALAWARQRAVTPSALSVQPSGVVAAGGAVGGDLFVVKYDAFGNQRWYRRIGGSATQKGLFAMDMDSHGAVAVAAEAWDGTIDLAPVTLGAADNAIMPFVAVFSPTRGATRWARALNRRADAYVEARALSVTGNDRVLVGGWFDTEVDFGRGAMQVSAEGAWDGFVVRFYP